MEGDFYFLNPKSKIQIFIFLGILHTNQATPLCLQTNNVTRSHFVILLGIQLCYVNSIGSIRIQIIILMRFEKGGDL